LERRGDQILSPPLARGTKGGLFKEVRENRTVLDEEGLKKANYRKFLAI